MTELKLFMLLAGCYPAERNTEQHDVFFGIGTSLRDITSSLKLFWPDALKLHIDSWREVTVVDDFSISIVKKTEAVEYPLTNKLFFINLGGYKKNDIEEYHYKMLVVADDKSDAIKAAKQTAFYKHTGFKGAVSHVDDKYGIDVDDIYQIEDILPAFTKEKYSIKISPNNSDKPDELHIGYLKLSTFE